MSSSVQFISVRLLNTELKAVTVNNWNDFDARQSESVKPGFQPTQRRQRNERNSRKKRNRNLAVLFPAELKFLRFNIF